MRDPAVHNNKRRRMQQQGLGKQLLLRYVCQFCATESLCSGKNCSSNDKTVVASDYKRLALCNNKGALARLISWNIEQSQYSVHDKQKPGELIEGKRQKISKTVLDTSSP